MNKDLVLNHKLVYVHVSLVITQFVSSLVIWTILAYVSTTGAYVLINIVAVLNYFVMYLIQVTIACIFIRVATPKKLEFVYRDDSDEEEDA